MIGRKRNNNRSRDFAVRLKDTQIRDDSLDKKRILKSLREALRVIKIQICCLSFFYYSGRLSTSPCYRFLLADSRVSQV